MKKTIFLLIALMMILSMFTACSEESGDNLYEESNYDNVSVFRPTDNESKNENNESENEAEDVSSPALSGEFTVKDKVYDFRGNNIAIVTVKNGTNYKKN